MVWQIRNDLLYEESIRKECNLELFVTTRCLGNMKDSKQRALLGKTINLDFSPLIYGEQIHSNNIFVFADSSNDSHLKGVDGLITNRSFIPLAIFIADCLPLFIVDFANHAVGILHSGWRGLSLKIIERGLFMMRNFYNTRIEDCLIGIGPYIKPCCYVVGKEVMDKFDKSDGEKISSHLWRLDLGKVSKRQLIELGIKRENISMCNMCTFHQADYFFSYRREKEQNRMMALIMLK